MNKKRAFERIEQLRRERDDLERRIAGMEALARHSLATAIEAHGSTYGTRCACGVVIEGSDVARVWNHVVSTMVRGAP